MSEQSEIMSPAASASASQPNSFPDGLRQLACAWVGLWSVAVEDLGTFYQRCVARGEQVLEAQARPSAAQPEVKPLASEAVAKREKAAAPRRVQPTTIMNAFGAVESYHIDLNAERLLPTKEELNALSERVDALAREVDALLEQRKS